MAEHGDCNGSGSRPVGPLRRFNAWTDRQVLLRLPEYALFPSDDKRVEAVRDLDTSLVNSGRFWVLATAAVVVLHATACVVMELAGPHLPMGRVGQVILANALFAPLGLGAVTWVWRREVARGLRAKLIDAGVPVCRPCGYNLRGVGAPRCPECGWQADAAVQALIDDTPGSL